MSLGNCKRCGAGLAVFHERRTALDAHGDERIVDAAGRFLSTDEYGNPIDGQPVVEPQVRCLRCKDRHGDVEQSGAVEAARKRADAVQGVRLVSDPRQVIA